MVARSGEDKKSWFRTERFYHTDEGWWFQTRESKEYGPFASFDDAELELMLFLRSLRNYAWNVEGQLSFATKPC